MAGDGERVIVVPHWWRSAISRRFETHQSR